MNCVIIKIKQPIILDEIFSVSTVVKRHLDQIENDFRTIKRKPLIVFIELIGNNFMVGVEMNQVYLNI